MAILRGAEARKYIQGGGAYRMPGQTSYVQGEGKPQRGFLGKVAAGIIDPFVDVAQLLGENVKEQAHLMGGGKMKDYKPTFMKESERQKFRSSPLEYAKTGASIASTIIPGAGPGASLGSMIGKGALTGTLAGFGATEGTELEDLLKGATTGAVTGGVVGGATYGIGKGLDKIKAGKAGKVVKTPDPLRKQLFKGVTTSKTKLTPSQLKGIEFDILDDFVDKGYIINTSDDIADNLPSLIGEYGDDFAKIKGVGKSVTGGKKSIIEKLTGTYSDDILDERFLRSSNPDMIRLGKQLQALPDNPTTLQLAEFIRTVDEVSGGFERAVGEKGSGWSLTMLRNLRKSSRGLIKGEASDFLTKQSQVIRVKDQILKAVEKPTGARAFGTQINIRKPVEKIMSKASRGLGGLRVPDKLKNILGSDVMQKAGQLGVSKAPLVGVLGSSGEPQAQGTGGMNVGGMGGGGMGMGMGGGAGGMGGDQSTLMALQLLGQGIPPGDVGTVMGLLGMGGAGGGKLSEKEKDFKMASDAASMALETLMTSGGAGKLATVTGKVGEFFGKAGTGTSYRMQLDTAAGFVRKALIGAAQTPQEMKKIQSLIPVATDETAVAERKLRDLIPLLQSYGNVGGGGQPGLLSPE